MFNKSAQFGNRRLQDRKNFFAPLRENLESLRRHPILKPMRILLIEDETKTAAFLAKGLREGGFNVGGEQSGHIIFSDFITTGDGLIGALQVLAVLAEERRPASEAAHNGRRRFPSPPAAAPALRGAASERTRSRSHRRPEKSSSRWRGRRHLPV